MNKISNNEIDARLIQATCAVLRDGQVAGTAWLVGDEGHLLSAGHVLGTDKPCDEVEVRFAEDIPRKAYKIQWGYQEDMGVDFAVLQLANPPVSRLPLPVSLSKVVMGRFWLRGYGVTLQEQSVGKGEFLGAFDVQGSSGNRLFQLRSPELGEEGYSGGAVFSDDLRAVVAVQIEATNTRLGAGRDTILAMPLYRIAQRWPALYRISGLHNSPERAQIKAASHLDSISVYGKPDKTTQMSRKQKAELVKALLACPTVSDRASRDTVVDELPDEIRHNIKRHSGARVDVMGIVSACLNYAGGISELIEIVGDYEGSSIPMQKVDELMRKEGLGT